MATAVFTTVVDRAVGDPLTEAIWDDQLKDNLNALASAHRNLLTNGGMEVAQRGAGPFTATLAWTLDRWQIELFSGKTVTVTPETTTVDGSVQSMKVVVAGTSGTVHLRQKLENLKEIRGREVSLSFRVNQGAASGCRGLYYANGAAATLGNTSATTGSFITLTQTVTPSAAATSIEFGMAFDTNGTYYVDNVMLVIGPAPAPYQPLHPAEDLARCQRYYEVHGGVADEFPDIAGSATAGALSFRSSIAWAVAKGGIPTVTKNGTWAVLNCAQPTVTAATPSGYSIQCVSTAGGQFATNPNSTDDTVVGEWAP